MNTPRPSPHQVQFSHLEFLCALLYAARHKVVSPVPGNPELTAEADRILIQTNMAEGIAAAIIDPALIMHFATNQYRIEMGPFQLPDAPFPQNQVIRLRVLPPVGSSLIMANGQPTGPNMAAVEQLKKILG